MQKKNGKYTADNLVPALRLFVEARNRAISAGFTDNGGAIHSVERILDILSFRVRYPHLRHINSLKKMPMQKSARMLMKRASVVRKY